MFRKCLENRVARKELGYKCYLCHFESRYNEFGMMQSHIEDKSHIQKIQKISYEQKRNELDTLSDLSESQLRRLAENSVTFDKINPHGSHFICHTCQCHIHGISNIFQHINGKLHIAMSSTKVQLIKGSNGVKKNENSKSSHPVIDSNDCFENIHENMYRCKICKCKVSGKANTQQHIKGYYHQEELLKAQHLSKKKNSLAETHINSIIDKPKIIPIHFIQIRQCLACQHFLKDVVSLQCHVMIHLYSEFDFPKNVDIIMCKYRENDDPIIKCLLCNVFVSNVIDLYKHLKTEVHTYRLNLFHIFKEDIEVNNIENVKLTNSTLTEIENVFTRDISIATLCTLCDVTIVGKVIHDHATGKKHVSNLHLHKNFQISSNDNKYEIKPQPEMDQNWYKCFMCDKSFNTLSNLTKHFNNNIHKQKMKCLGIILKNPELNFDDVKCGSRSVLMCRLCKLFTENSRTAIEHILGKRHQLELTNINKSSTLNLNLNETEVQDNKNHPAVEIHVSNINKVLPSKKSMKNSDVKNSQASFSTESSSQNVNDILNDLINMDLKETDQKRLPPSSKPKQSEKSPTAPSRMNIFNKNVLYYGKNFIKYCIEPGRQCIYNIDPEQMRLMKLGASCVMPLNSQLVCIPCGEQFAIDKQVLFEHLQDSKHVDYLTVMEKEDETFAEYPDQFSHLKLAKYFMAEESDEWVQCFACNTNVNNDNSDIRLHTEMPHHIAVSQNWKEALQAFYKDISGVFEDLWYYAQVFICEICPKKCEMEMDFVIHLGKSAHLNEVQKLTAQGIPLKFDICPVCTTFWYGKPEAHKLHCESMFHKRLAKNGDFTVPKMSSMTLDLLNNLESKIVSLTNDSDRVNSEKNRELQLLKDIEDTVKPEYPGAKAYIFGSRLSNLGFPDSDVDVFLDCQDLYHKSTTQEESKLHLLNVKKYFERNSDMWIIDEILLSTRVPIMKLRYIPTGLKCDISFINGLSVEKSTLVGDYNNAYPICRQLILYLKKWLTSCKLAGTECITTFAISWFVIFYLQVKGIVPSVWDLIRLKDESKLIGGWECGFEKCIPITPSELTFKEHLKGFFSYYAKFDYRTHVICPFLGILIKKRRFAYPETLPDELEIYKRRLRAEHSLMFRFDSPIAIQDPVDLSQNMTKAVKKLQLRCFRQYCAESYEKI